jgi:hypothetical protein
VRLLCVCAAPGAWLAGRLQVEQEDVRAPNALLSAWRKQYKDVSTSKDKVSCTTVCACMHGVNMHAL